MTLIIGKFKDYYDEELINNGGYPVYVRKTRMWDIDEWSKYFPDIYKYHTKIPKGYLSPNGIGIQFHPYTPAGRYWIGAKVIGVTGRLYPIWTLNRYACRPLHASSFQMLIQQIKTWVIREHREQLIEAIVERDYEKSMSSTQPITIGKEMFSYLSSPTFIYEPGNVLRTHIKLSNLAIDRLIPPRSIANRIDNYLENVCNIRKETREVFFSQDGECFLTKEEAQKYEELNRPCIIDSRQEHSWKEGDIGWMRGLYQIYIYKVYEETRLSNKASSLLGKRIYQIVSVIKFYVLNSPSKLLMTMEGEEIGLITKEAA